MNKVIKAIATSMIVILIVALVGIFLSYYKDNEATDTFIFESGNSNVSTLNIPSGEYINNVKRIDISNNEGLIESIIKDSTESNLEDIKNQESNDNNSQNPENINNNNSGDTIPYTIIDIPDNSKADSNQFVISSNSQTSNQEKQEVLDEIDKALQGLLEAVGKVEIVDETRLEATLNSEVDKP